MTKQKLTLKFSIPAKLNIDFHVMGKKGEMHTISTLVQSIDIYDRVEYIDSNNTLSIDIHSTDEYFKNEIFLEHLRCKIKVLENIFGELKGEIKIQKGIPIGYGLGGSSAVLVGLIKIFETVFDKKLSPKEIVTISSDALVMYNQGRYHATGIGEIIEKVEDVNEEYLLILPKQRALTENIYSEFDRIEEIGKSENDFIQILRSKNAEVEDILNIAENKGVEVRMTGSGSCMYTINTDENRRIFSKYKQMVVHALGGRNE